MRDRIKKEESKVIKGEEKRRKAVWDEKKHDEWKRGEKRRRNENEIKEQSLIQKRNKINKNNA